MSVEHSSPLGSSAGHPEQEHYHSSSLPDSGGWPAGQEQAPLRTGRHGTVRARTPRRRAGGIWFALATIVLLAVLTASIGLYAFDRSYAGKIYPNVTVRGVAVGELTPDAARAALEARFAPFLAQPVTLTYADQSWTPTLAELGVRLELDRAIARAYGAGRGNNLLANLREIYAIYRDGLELPLHLTVDQATMQAYLISRGAEIDRPARDARLELDGTLIARAPAASGQQILVSETLQEITAALESLTPQTVTLRTRVLLPRLDDAAARVAQAEIARLLAGPITLNIEGVRQPVIWSPEELAGLVRVERVSGADQDALRVVVDREQVQMKLAELAEATAIKGRLPRVDWNGGDLRIFEPGRAGRSIDVARAEELLLAALSAPAAARQIVLPLVEAPAPVTAANLGQLGITNLLSVGRSDFSGSAAYRVTNIKAGMRLLHGVLVPPGEEFSFNTAIGRIDASNGFVEGYAIVQNRTQLEWGGGICQDSTTVFRAAFWAGLPITERWGHSFYISWYDKYAFGQYGNGPGMDATIFTGALDLKFLNDTGNWLLVQTSVDESRSLAEVRIYGTDDGRNVLLRGPTITDRIPAPTQPRYIPDPKRPRGSIRQSDTARGGMTIQFTRVVERGGEVLEQRTFETKFKPWPNIYEVNPADLGPDGRPIPYQPTPDPAELPTPDPNSPPPAEGEQPAPPAEGEQPAPPAEGEQPTPPVEGTPVPGLVPQPEPAPQPPDDGEGTGGD